MPISCNPNDLADAAKCFCFDRQTGIAIELMLLATLAGGSMDPNVLAAQAASGGWTGLTNKEQQDGMRLMLLCQAAKAAGA